VLGALDIEGQKASSRYLLTQASTGLGRDRRNEVCLEDPAVSRFHARISCSAEGCVITDLGSATGTRVDGEELQARAGRELHEGARIDIGPFSLRFARAVPGGAERALGEGGDFRECIPSAAGLPVVVSSAPAAVLVVTPPNGKEEHELRGSSLTLGRDPSNDLVIDFDTVSRRHARLERRDSTWEIVDLGSANGLQASGVPVTRKSLADGDSLTIGRSVLLQYHQSHRAGTSRGAQPAELSPPADGSLVLGRSEGADVMLSHPLVSRAHARVTRRGAELIVEDLGSSTGTYVNGRPVRRQALAEGDVLRIGASRMEVTEGRLRIVNEEGNLRIDAVHLWRQVGKGLRILQDVSLSIMPQEFVAIVGGSGSGKTTLLNALCGFRPATSGSVLLNGVDLYRSLSAYRNDMGYVPQDDIIHRELPVLRALRYAAELRMPRDTAAEERRQRVQHVLQQLDIHTCWDRAIRELSGGQRKRVSMGVELLTRPSLFFLDEATSGLDPGTESQMMRLLRRLADEGRTVVLVTHATKNVMTCDKVVFLARGGHLAFFGAPEEALRYFEVDDFDEIYMRLEQDDACEWGRRFRFSQAYQDNIGSRLADVPGFETAPPIPRPPEVPPQRPRIRRPSAVATEYPSRAPARGAAAAQRTTHLRQVSGFRQFQILCLRQLDTIWGDKKTAILLLALAPFLGVLDFLIWRRDMFDPQTGSATQAVMMFFITSIITILIGTITSVREIVKEDAVYKRERMVGLRVLPFVASKAAVGFLFALYSAVMLFLFMIAAVDFSHLTALQTLSILVPMILGTFSGVMWGLLVSALAPTEDRAMLMVIVVLVPQFVFSGGIIPIKDIGVAGTVLGWLTSARWELGAIVTSAEVAGGRGIVGGPEGMSLPGIEGLGAAGERGLTSSLQDQYGRIFHVNVGLYWLMALLLSLLLFLVVLYLQKRKDTF
jgi:ABC-type multidrug transport system ATPase subunit